LESLWKDTGKIDKNKKEVIYTPLIVKTGGIKLNNLDINLKLTEDLFFSMTNFDKVNKGLANQNINCYMNVTLQSLIACPAFFNMLTAISESKDNYHLITDKREFVRKFVELSRHFEPKV
jgi:ubiquitin C-terminal hydrolase